MSIQTNSDPLAGLYLDDETEEVLPDQQEDPLAGLYVEPEKDLYQENIIRDVVKEKQKESGIEEDILDTSDIERAAERGQAEATRGLLSGATFGISEKIPGLKTSDNIAATTGEFTGSLIPIEFMTNLATKSAVEIAKRSPIFKKSLESLAHITGVGVAGGLYGGITEAVEKEQLPDTDTILEHGVEWAALDGALRVADKAYGFASGLIEASRKKKIQPFKVINEINNELKANGIEVEPSKRVGDKAMEILEEMNNQKVKEKSRAIPVKKFEKAESQLPEFAEPILPEKMNEQVNVNRMVVESESNAVKEKIESIGKETLDNQVLGKEVKEGIESYIERAEAEYKPYYQEAEQAAHYIEATTDETAKIAGDMFEDIRRMSTKPDKYGKVISTLESVLNDVGFKIIKDEAGVIEDIIKVRNVFTDDLMELGRRLNKIVKYDLIDKGIVDTLKPVVASLKNDIRTSIKGTDVESAWELAEKAFGIKANRINRESVRKIRGMQASEMVPSVTESATAMQDLRQVVSPEVMANVERNVLDRMNRMTESKAREYLKKVRGGLSKRSQSIADDIITSKIPLNKETITERANRLHDVVVNDITNAMETGFRPNKALDLWQNNRGQKLVKEALKDHPQKKEIIKYLNDQTMQDIAHSIVNKEGAIDIQKLDKLMSNKAMVENIRMMGGEEAVRYFETLNTKAKGIKKNASELMTEKFGLSKKKPIEDIRRIAGVPQGEQYGISILKRMAKKDFPMVSKLNSVLENLGIEGKTTLTLFTALKFGLLKGLMIPATANILKKLATSRKARLAFDKASKHHMNPLLFLAAIEEFGKEIEE